MSGYQKFVQEKWRSFQIEGWGGYVFREKLKLIKSTLKEWHVVHAKNNSSRIDLLKVCFSEYDDKGVEDELSAEEIENMRNITHEIHSLALVSTSICWQQSCLLWLKDGDANSKYFHSILSSRRRCNAIVSLMVNGSLIEGVQPIRNTVYTQTRGGEFNF